MTDPKKDRDVDGVTREKAAAFFRDHLVPAAEKLRARNVRFFPLAPETSADQTSWFVPYAATREEELDGAPSAERLATRWAEQPELAALAAPLFALAEELHETETERSEVSPFVYVMF